jgi:hypothetical protein
MDDTEARELDLMRRVELLARDGQGRDLAVKRTLQLIDRALDVGNRRRFVELCGLLRDCKANEAARVSRAPATP